MSVRAYRIDEIKYADNPSFNLRDDEQLIRFLNEDGEISFNLNTYGSGRFEISVNRLAKAIKNAKQLKIDEDTVKQLKQDIEFAKSHNNEYALYDCF